MYNYKMPERKENSNKGNFGKVLNIAGSDNYIGAAYLSSCASLKIGAGLVTLASNKNVINSVSKMLPEVVYITREQAVKDFDNYTVLMIGCGLGKTYSAKNDFKKFIQLANKYSMPTVIDADGLNILAENSNNIELPQNAVITPHPVEASRLLNCSLDDVLNNLTESAKQLSKKFNCVAVLKTHQTIICKGENIFINQHGNSSLAKAGTGDVLTGILSGLLAQKMEPMEATKLGVYLHSVSGELASEKLTEYSVLATDVINYIPNSIKTIL